jgi:hypothetical protein
VPEDVRALFDDYATAYARGEQPQARDYLARAGDGADELGRLLEAFLGAAPRPQPNADTIALVSAWAENEPPLVHLRASRGVRVKEVVDAIVEEAGLAPTAAPKVKRYYQRLEQGRLDPSGVSERVWNVLRRLIGPAADTAAAWHARPPAPQAAFYRAAIQLPAADAAMAKELLAPERDEVDELFTSRT